MDCVVGIDLSGISRSAAGRTVAAEVALEEPLRLVALYPIDRELAGDLQIVELVADRRPRVVAIDAPLSLPHSVSCMTAGCPRYVPGRASYPTRDVDGHADGMSTSRLAPIAFRGIYLARILRERGFTVIETYPRAVFRALRVDQRSGRDPAAAREALAGRIAGVTSDQADELDAPHSMRRYLTAIIVCR